MSQPKFERGDVVTPYTPALEELLPYINAVSMNGYTLHGVGDYRDRLECRVGVWGIERQVEYVQDTNKVVQNLRLEMAEQEVDTLAAIEQLKITNNLS